MARALVLNPEVLLLDEPLSNLDAKLRVKVRYEIRELRQQFNITTVFVTHDQEEALSISDKIAVMNQGVVEQFGTPREIYSSPRNEFVAAFIGEAIFLAIDVKAINPTGDTTEIRFKWRDRLFTAESRQSNIHSQKITKILLRPETFELTGIEPSSGSNHNRIPGVVCRSSFLGTITRYWVDIGGQLLIVDDAKTSTHGCFSGEVWVGLPERNIHFL